MSAAAPAGGSRRSAAAAVRTAQRACAAHPGCKQCERRRKGKRRDICTFKDRSTNITPHVRTHACSHAEDKLVFRGGSVEQSRTRALLCGMQVLDHREDRAGREGECRRRRRRARSTEMRYLDSMSIWIVGAEENKGAP